MAYFDCWHASDGAIAHSWFNMLDTHIVWRISILISWLPCIFLVGSWAKTHIAMSKSKWIQGDGKTGDVCFDDRCTGRTAIWLGMFLGDCSTERVEIWLCIMPDDCVGRIEAWLCVIPDDCSNLTKIITYNKVKWILSDIECWFCTVVAVPEHFRRGSLSFHEKSSDCAQIFCSLALFSLETPFLRAFLAYWTHR